MTVKIIWNICYDTQLTTIPVNAQIRLSWRGGGIKKRRQENFCNILQTKLTSADWISSPKYHSNKCIFVRVLMSQLLQKICFPINICHIKHWTGHFTSLQINVIQFRTSPKYSSTFPCGWSLMKCTQNLWFFWASQGPFLSTPILVHLMYLYIM